MKTFTTLSISFVSLLTALASAQAGDPKGGASATPAMTMPKPPAELVELSKLAVGTWKCSGQSSMDGKTMTDVKATITIKLDLDKWWLQTAFTASMGKATYTFTGYTTYNGLDKKWNRYMVDNMGSFEADTASGLTGGKMTWDGDSKMSVAMMPGMPATMKSRHTEELTDKTMHMVGEASMDGGKTWMKAYEAACKK